MGEEPLDAPAAEDVAPRRRRRWWTAPLAVLAAAALLVALAVGADVRQLRLRLVGLEQELAQARQQADETNRLLAEAQRLAADARLAEAVLAAPALQRIDLDGEPAAPEARGRAFWAPTRGLIFAATGLPPLAGGRTYQVWIVTPERPVGAGLLEPDAAGQAILVVEPPRDPTTPVAFSVTLEPAGGSPAPTGERVLLGTVPDTQGLVPSTAPARSWQGPPGVTAEHARTRRIRV
jgi:hypothetical protein